MPFVSDQAKSSATKKAAGFGGPVISTALVGNYNIYYIPVTVWTRRHTLFIIQIHSSSCRAVEWTILDRLYVNFLKLNEALHIALGLISIGERREQCWVSSSRMINAGLPRLLIIKS